MEDHKKTLAAMGFWSLVGLLATLFAVTYFGGANYLQIIKNIILLVTGKVALIPSGSGTGLIGMVLEITTVILITIALAILVGSIVSHGSKSYDQEALEKMLARGPWVIFITVALEELFARWLFLGVLGSVFHGNTAFYILFILGNVIWAGFHLYNFKDAKERSILKVLPQLIGGIAFTYIFVRFGIFVAIMTHYFYDVVLMASMKMKQSIAVNFVNGLYYLIIGTILFFVGRASGINLSSLKPWLNGQIVPLDGYGFFGYALILTLVSCIASVLTNALLLDSTDAGDSYTKLFEMKGSKLIITLVIAAVATVALIFFGNWLLGLFIKSFVFRAVILTVILSFASKTVSGSSMARSTLVNLPVTFLIVVAFSVLGFWAAFGIALVNIFIDLIPSYLES